MGIVLGRWDLVSLPTDTVLHSHFPVGWGSICVENDGGETHELHSDTVQQIYHSDSRAGGNAPASGLVSLLPLYFAHHPTSQLLIFIAHPPNPYPVYLWPPRLLQLQLILQPGPPLPAWQPASRVWFRPLCVHPPKSVCCSVAAVGIEKTCEPRDTLTARLASSHFLTHQHTVIFHLFYLSRSLISHQFALCQTSLPSFICKLTLFSVGTPVCTDLTDLLSISSHSSVKWGAPCPVWLIGVGSSLKEAAGSSWPGESGCQVQRGLSSAHSVSLGTGPFIQQRFPGLRSSQPWPLEGPGVYSPTAHF
jgi:hypothetical protein